MDWLSVLHVLLLAFFVFVICQLTRLYFADSDLTLQWAHHFGVPTSHLRGKVVWITGASSGIGEHLSYELAAAGCRLVLSARRKDELERVKKQCQLSGRVADADILVLPLDVVKFDTHKEHVRTVIDHFKQINILVNNAGRSQRAHWQDISLLVDREMLEVNVLGVLSLTRAVLPHMITSKGGQIVVVSSMAGKLGTPLSGSYSGSKHALHGLFETLRIEGHAMNIKITMVCPGHVFSSIRQKAMTEKPGEEYGVKMKPNERRMSTSRCALLMAVAIANQLDEVWISIHPVLLFTYMAQYMPTLARRLAVRIGMRVIEDIRHGK
ncbi:dehydrogenase/reductase SDR family member 7-like [Liolophura sinensis]|uniref:dehydrogenase/reductase SDR family member 7-like n=1 Tax=Liolophura sinensis TaxID=3198878 RepID=UPI003158ED03